MQARTASLLTFLVATGAAAWLSAAPALAAARVQEATETILDTGEASWYGPRHEGLRTFSGERFDSRKMTAAHASLPIGTMVRVTDVATGRSIIVRVNDREPPHGVRCIDLSEGAALALGMHSRGLAEVTLTSGRPEAIDQTADAAPVEVAEAPDDEAPRHVAVHRATARHGRQHRRHAAR